MVTAHAEVGETAPSQTPGPAGTPEALIEEARVHRRHRLRFTAGVVVLAAVLASALTVAIGGSGGNGTPGGSAALPPIRGAVPVDLSQGLSSSMSAAQLVSCAGGGCVVVGDVVARGTPDVHPVARLYEGGRWASLAAPRGWGSYQPQGLSCSSPTACVLIGSYWTASPRGLTRAFAEVFRDGRWTNTFVPIPRSSLSSSLDAVSCPSAHWCMATGTEWNGTGNHPFAARWNGTRWSVVDVPLPPRTQVGSESSLASVSCVSSSWCMGVGSATRTVRSNVHWSTASEPWAEIWSHGRWRLTVAPIALGLTRALADGTEFTLSGLSCVSSSWCAASGSGDASGAFEGSGSAELATWDGQRWHTVLRTAWYVTELGPNVITERGAPRIGVELGGLGSMACSSPTRCVTYVVAATGGLVDRSSPLAIFELDGRTWHQVRARLARRLPLVANSVSCLHSGSCLVVGNYASIHATTAQTGAVVVGVAAR